MLSVCIAAWLTVIPLVFLSGISAQAQSAAKVQAQSTVDVQTPSQAPAKYKLALPGYKYSFPRDHASHDEFKTEWWYYTGHLKAEDGSRYGYELTFFRSAMNPPRAIAKGSWTVNNIYMAHFAVSDLNAKRFYYKEKLTRPGVKFAGSDTTQYSVWNEQWKAGLSGKGQSLQASTPEYAIDLTLDSDKPPAIHGENGVSQKANCVGCASHYYSFTRLNSKGTITINGKRIPVTGLSWMDHEFGSNQLTKDQVGWDWFSIQLDDKSEIMLYVMRLKNGGIDPNSSGTIVASDGTVRHLRKGDYTITPTSKWLSPHTKAEYPLGWKVSIPGAHLAMNIEPSMPDQELAKSSQSNVSYWEGACAVGGTQSGKHISGQAYVEMTGYHEQFREGI